MDSCWLQGATGDALHAISCAAGYNVRWLLRAIAALGVGAVFLRLLFRAAWDRLGGDAMSEALSDLWPGLPARTPLRRVDAARATGGAI